MTRYNELIEAIAVVQSATHEIWLKENQSPAWVKLLRVQAYLRKQAGHVMEGRTEDGADPALVDEIMGQLGFPAVAPRGWDAVEGGVK